MTRICQLRSGCRSEMPRRPGPPQWSQGAERLAREPSFRQAARPANWSRFLANATRFRRAQASRVQEVWDILVEPAVQALMAAEPSPRARTRNRVREHRQEVRALQDRLANRLEEFHAVQQSLLGNRPDLRYAGTLCPAEPLQFPLSPLEEVMVLQGIWDGPDNLRYEESPKEDRDWLVSLLSHVLLLRP